MPQEIPATLKASHVKLSPLPPLCQNRLKTVSFRPWAESALPHRPIARADAIAVASPPILLNLSPGADVQPFFVTAGISGMLGFVMLLAAALAIRQRRHEM